MSSIRINASVTHPSHGSGTVVSISRDFRGQATGAKVEFVIRGHATWLWCQARDLAVVEAARPALRVIEPVLPGVA